MSAIHEFSSDKYQFTGGSVLWRLSLYTSRKFFEKLTKSSLIYFERQLLNSYNFTNMEIHAFSVRLWYPWTI